MRQQGENPLATAASKVNTAMRLAQMFPTFPAVHTGPVRRCAGRGRELMDEAAGRPAGGLCIGPDAFSLSSHHELLMTLLLHNFALFFFHLRKEAGI